MQTKHLAVELEVKSINEDGTFSGYGSVFNNEDSYGDVVLPGAFTKSLEAWTAKGAPIPILWQHKSAEPVGVWTSAKEDARGLFLEGRLLIKEDPLAARAYAHLKAGSVRGLSIGYSVPEGGEAFDATAKINRLSALDLYEVSIVTFPANTEAQVVHVRSDAGLDDPRALELALRDAGLSRREAKAVLAGGIKAALTERDAQEEPPAVEPAPETKTEEPPTAPVVDAAKERESVLRIISFWR